MRSRRIRDNVLGRAVIMALCLAAFVAIAVVVSMAGADSRRTDRSDTAVTTSRAVVDQDGTVGDDPGVDAAQAAIDAKARELADAERDVACEVQGTGGCATGTPTSNTEGCGPICQEKMARAARLRDELEAMRGGAKASTRTPTAADVTTD